MKIQETQSRRKRECYHLLLDRHLNSFKTSIWFLLLLVLVTVTLSLTVKIPMCYHFLKMENMNKRYSALPKSLVIGTVKSNEKVMKQFAMKLTLIIFLYLQNSILKQKMLVLGYFTFS